MAHQSETDQRLQAVRICGGVDAALRDCAPGNNDAWLVVWPETPRIGRRCPLMDLAGALGPDALLAILTTPGEAARLVPTLSGAASFQLWVAVKLSEPAPGNARSLPSHHAALLIFSKYRRSLRHTKTRIAYTFCPACDKTTKDYGGKKHTYNHYGTLISDVWRDVAWAPVGDLAVIEQRLADLFAVAPHRRLFVWDLRHPAPTCTASIPAAISGGQQRDELTSTTQQARTESQLFLGDCLARLREISNDCIDFCFADPPYNIDKKYDSWDDALDLQKYFQWCDAWLDELARVLRPGCTCAVLNIPQFAVRHFTRLSQQLRFQNWIVWEGLSLPVRMIMPAHYAIVCFSKGPPRMLPAYSRARRSELETDAITALREFYCVRQSCIQARRANGESDRQPLTDLWWDIHRLKHNSRRVDHPCQLPPALMYRLIAAFTHPGEIVLDPFNGAGTTTLCAAQLDRRYIGIEMSPQYHAIAVERHALLARGGNPFAKAASVPKAKNSRVKRIGNIEYAVSKKKLQLEVREIAKRLGRLPTRDDVEQHSEYPIRYFDEYFISWGEVCAAARTTGMQETRETPCDHTSQERQVAFDFITEAT